MIEFLAIIGLAIILWWTAKKIGRAGDALVRFGDSLMDRITIESPKSKSCPDTERRLKELEAKLRHTKGEETDDEYNEKIRREIDELTEGKNQRR